MAVALFAIVPAGAKANVFTKLAAPSVAGSAAADPPATPRRSSHRRTRSTGTVFFDASGTDYSDHSVTSPRGRSVEFAILADNAHNVEFGDPGIGRSGPQPTPRAR